MVLYCINHFKKLQISRLTLIGENLHKFGLAKEGSVCYIMQYKLIQLRCY